MFSLCFIAVCLRCRGRLKTDFYRLLAAGLHSTRVTLDDWNLPPHPNPESLVCVPIGTELPVGLSGVTRPLTSLAGAFLEQEYSS